MRAILRSVDGGLREIQHPDLAPAQPNLSNMYHVGPSSTYRQDDPPLAGEQRYKQRRYRLVGTIEGSLVSDHDYAIYEEVPE